MEKSIDLMWRMVQEHGDSDECLLWVRGLTEKGYFRVSDGTKLRKGSRLVLADKLGRPLAHGILACHHCDAPACFNPRHLFEGTFVDNMQDALAKGRLPTTAKGNYVRVNIAHIKARHLAGAGIKTLAREYGVDRNMLRDHLRA